MNLGLSVKIALAKNSMTATELAEKAGLGVSQISLISTNKRNTSTETLKKLAQAFSMSVSDFIELGEEK